jgi:hypothetical protein
MKDVKSFFSEATLLGRFNCGPVEFFGVKIPDWLASPEELPPGIVRNAGRLRGENKTLEGV